MDTKIDLKKITLLCFDGRPEDIERSNRYREILDYMLSKIDFYAVKFFYPFDFQIDGIECIKIEQTSIGGYSRFCIRDLNKYIESEFCLIFQDDGFILNPDLWDDCFYEYDYIGAPWPLYIGWPQEGKQVGNGGFSLRSKKFLEISSNLPVSYQNEDTYILLTNRENLNKNSIKIAPLEIARNFSVEIPLDNEHNIENCFGFHSKRHLEKSLKYIKKKK
jgi:hypothetical protein